MAGRKQKPAPDRRTQPSSSSSSSSPSKSSKSSSPSSTFTLRDIILIRLINAWYLATFFQPDEFFQALEPAWQLAFGPQSGAWLTWEWQYQLRSSLHPILFSGAYLAADRLSAAFPPESFIRSAAVIVAPRVLQAVIAALGDWFTWKLAMRIYSPDNSVSFITLFLQLFSPWQWYCSTRTFSNSLETTLTVMALYYWPWQLLGSAPALTKENPKPVNVLRTVWPLRSSLCLAALAVVLRPTNVLIWATIAGLTLTRVTLRGASPLTLSTVLVLFREALLCGSLAVGFSSLAVFYGRNPWHYYILQGIPLLCTTSLPFAVPSLFKPSAKTADQENTLKTLSYTIFVTVISLSLISHKEVRFIYPLLPALNVLAAPRVASFFTYLPAAPQEPPRPNPRLPAALSSATNPSSYPPSVSTFSSPATSPSSTNPPPSQSSPSCAPNTNASTPLPYSSPTRHTTAPPPEQQEDLFALFLMPCHSTPWRSHLVYPGLSARALTCEPPLHTQPNTPERDNYRDEADRFYDDPIHFLRTELFPREEEKTPRPRYIIGFEGIEPWLGEFLQTSEGRALGFKLQRVWAGFNGFFNEDWRRAGHMLVWDTGLYN
ncbi:GPI mannosyltransferase 3 [Cladobotryum mycophilum]|uniref:Mannosyltransferase n=1 Tax=Cladobotryum mycophilum TaxID=491253 RepID=A0ABR0SBI9_9HYPO